MASRATQPCSTTDYYVQRGTWESPPPLARSLASSVCARARETASLASLLLPRLSFCLAPRTSNYERPSTSVGRSILSLSQAATTKERTSEAALSRVRPDLCEHERTNATRPPSSLPHKNEKRNAAVSSLQSCSLPSREGERRGSRRCDGVIPFRGRKKKRRGRKGELEDVVVFEASSREGGRKGVWYAATLRS